MKTIAVMLIAFVAGLFFWQSGWQRSKKRIDTGTIQEITTYESGKNEPQAITPINILQTWEMPDVLREISGIAYISDNQFACVQDEVGTIFIYNTQTGSIEEEIPFGEAGDYEGITLAGNTAYIVRSDGRLYEVTDYRGPHPEVRQYATFLTAVQDVEGLCYDRKTNRLLLAIKGPDLHSQDYKGIYAFDLSAKKLLADPVFKIPVDHPGFTSAQKSKKKSLVQPSDLEVHPLTGDIYLTDAARHQLIVLDAKGEIKAVHPLEKSLFAKPEGISFSPSGTFFISSEGKKEKGNIRQIELGK